MKKANEFGYYLKEARKKHGKSQENLALIMNKTIQYISNLEQGKNNPPSREEDILLIAKELELNNEETKTLIKAAISDRKQLLEEQMDYIVKEDIILELIQTGRQKKISNKKWNKLLNNIE